MPDYGKLGAAALVVVLAYAVGTIVVLFAWNSVLSMTLGITAITPSQAAWIVLAIGLLKKL